MGMRVLGIGPVGTLVATGVLDEGSRIILADFSDRTGDSALATTFTEAFRVDLSQSRILRLLPAAELRGALQRMQRDPGTPLTPDLAREVAVREGITAVVAGDINAAGGGFVLSTQLLDPESGNVIAAFRETAADSTAIIRAIDRLSKELRGRAGESLKSIRAARPLFRVTTASLPALRKYSQAQRTFQEGNTSAAIELLREAVALDTTFAEAYRRLATHLGNAGIQPSAQLKAMTKAYKHRDRLPETERHIVIATYLMDVTGDYHGALEAYSRVLEIDSTHPVAVNNSGVAYSLLRDDDRAAQFYERQIRLYPRGVLGNSNLVEAQLNRGALDGVRSALENFRRVLPDHPLARRAELLVAWALGRHDSAEAIARTIRERHPDPGNAGVALSHLSGLAAVRGRLREANEHGLARVRLFENRGLPNEALRYRVLLARRELEVGGGAREVLAEVEEQLSRSSGDEVDPLDPPYLDIAMLYLSTGRMDRARVWVDAYERNVPAEWRRGRAGSELQHLRALGSIALADGRVQDAIRLLRQSDQGECVICALPQLAQAYDAAPEPDSAIAIYERYVGTLSPDRPAVDPLELPPALKRLGELYAQRGDREKAIEYYNRFVELWKGADPELQPLVRDVKQRMARLAGEAGPR
ncbi:MAG: tetratricopeptide repeat protein [Gemmatimonadetes bacterium]|nr:tetratricopeptide repeat protein [Gemmatimonadota bacterium]